MNIGVTLRSTNGRSTCSITPILLAIMCLAVCVAEVPVATPAEDVLETIPYADPTFGFEIQVPAGWIYDRGRFRGAMGSIGVLRGSRDYTRAIQILVFRNFEMTGFEQWLQEYEQHLEEVHGSPPVRLKADKRDGRERVVTMVEVIAGSARARTYYLCITFDPNTVWVMALAGQVTDGVSEKLLQAQFEQLADTVRISYDPLEAQQLSAAFDRGLAVLKELRASARAVKLEESERYYNIAIGDKSIGYLLRRIYRESRSLTDPRMGGKHKEGLRVQEESWRFADDGTVRHTELNMFSSFDLRSEMMEQCTTQIPAPDVAAQRLYIELDQCLRENQVLFSSFSTNIDRDLPDPRPPIKVGQRYLDLAWVRLLPQLLISAPAELYAFAVYDSGTRALLVHTIKPLGPLENASRPGYAFEIRQGFVSQPSLIHTDTVGNVVLIKSGDLTIELSTREQVERDYAGRREPARRRVTTSAGPTVSP
ncbi:MAG: hypothetical protein ABIG44_11230 [Planctomycetota bacterium]